MMKSRFKINWVGRGCMFLMGALALIMFSPTVTYDVDALENTTSVAKTRAVVQLAATVSVALDSEVNIDITPTIEGAFGFAKAQLHVATNSPAGYAVYLNTLDETNAMTNVVSGVTGEISSITGKRKAEDFANNTWGFALTRAAVTDATEYQAIPVSSTEIVRTGELTQNDIYDLTFGVKANGALPAGRYSNSVMVSVIANPQQITNLSQMVYMQDMTSGICANTSVETTKQLIDVRDGKEYWVAKLADDNCWMTQNLALDLTAGEKLTSADSDVTTDWVIPRSTENSIPEKDAVLDVKILRSWNLGEYVIKQPASQETCKNGTQTVDGVESETVAAGNTLDACDILQKVENWKPTFEANETGGVFTALNDGPKQYDAHYFIGNYYMYNTATAGTVIDKKAWYDEEATGSICPKGWRLPTVGNAKINNINALLPEYSFYELFLKYGYADTGEAYWPILNEPNQNPMTSQTAFALAGMIMTSEGGINMVGGSVGYWYATLDPNINYAAVTTVNRRGLNTNSGMQRDKMGESVRCVAR